MPKTCPNGFICIENMSIILVIIIFLLAFIVYLKFIANDTQKVVYVEEKNNFSQNMPLTQMNSNILQNPFSPPLKVNRYFDSSSSDVRVPINVPTRGFREDFKQVGILTRDIGKETILPIMGRRLYTNNSKWQYYTMTDKSNSIRLPMSHNGRSCTSEYGCDELMNGDVVYVEGYKDAFKVTIYENSQPRYIPHL
jgi:Ca2+/Na+ antiporter